MPKQSRKLILPVFTLTEVCDQSAKDSVVRKIPVDLSVGDAQYYFRRTSFSNSRESYLRLNNFPVVTDGNGGLWIEANLYILSKVYAALQPNMGTCSGIADDLAAYRRFLDEEQLDFKVFPQQKLLRPTYRYRNYLKLLIDSGELSASTVRRRLGAVIGFYRWMFDEHLLIPTHKPWEERDTYIQITDRVGHRISKRVKTTDITINVPKQKDPYDGRIGNYSMSRLAKSHFMRQGSL